MAYTMISLCSLFYIARLLASLLLFLRDGTKSLTGSWDDLFVTLSYALTMVILLVDVVAGLPNGIGKDIWMMTSEQITNLLFWFFINEVIYFVALSTIKMSLLALYLRIFNRCGITPLLWGTVAVNALYGVVFVVVTCVQCQPTSYTWNGWDGEHSGTCWNINAGAFAGAGVSIAIDIWMIFVPLWQIRKLQLRFWKKVSVAAMLCVGAL
jgi:hypothetical protein